MSTSTPFLTRITRSLSLVGTPLFGHAQLMDIDFAIELGTLLADEFDQSVAVTILANNARDEHQGWIDQYYMTFLWPARASSDMLKFYEYLVEAVKLMEVEELEPYVNQASTYIRDRNIYTISWSL